jgi:multiple sugar transport system permease protein
MIVARYRSQRKFKNISINYTQKPSRFHKFLPWVIPSLIVLVLFVLIPLLTVLEDSSNNNLDIASPNYNKAEPSYSFGIQAFREVATDRDFKKATINSLIYIAIQLPLSLLLAILISGIIVSFMNKRIKGFLQTIFFLPFVTAAVAISLTFTNIFGDFLISPAGSNDKPGVLNWFMRLFGGDGYSYLLNPNSQKNDLSSSTSTFAAIVMFGVWRSLALNVLILTTAMLSVNKDLYKSSSIDGASRTKQFMFITLPQVNTTISYLITVTIIGSFKVFPLALYQNDSSQALEYFPTLMLYVYYQVSKANYWLASAASIIILFMSLGISVLVRIPKYTKNVRDKIHIRRNYV